MLVEVLHSERFTSILAKAVTARARSITSIEIAKLRKCLQARSRLLKQVSLKEIAKLVDVVGKPDFKQDAAGS